MLIRSRKPWELTENDVTPEHLYRNRRQIMAAAGMAGLAARGPPGCAPAQDEEAEATAPAAGAEGELAFAKSAYEAAPDGSGPTAFEAITGYNNFYEFGTSKDEPARYAHTMTVAPWS